MFRRWWEQFPPVTKNILAINFIVFLVDALLQRFGLRLSTLLGLCSWSFGAFSMSPLYFHVWQPFTYMFMHSGLDHIFFNLFAILMFGPTVERELGTRKYLLYYIVCGVGAALVQELVWMLGNGAPAITVGASGAVFGILLAFAWLFPEQRMFLLFIPIPIPARIFVGIYAVLELLAGVAAPAGDFVAHFAHLGGLIFGALLILYWKWKDRHPKDPFRDRSKDYSDYHYKDPIR